MITDLESLDGETLFDSDVCIVGAGAAGITVALQLEKLGQKVTLCEAGGFEISDDSQSCYVGEIRGDPYFDLDYARLRYLGGSTNHWSGWCRPFEEIDFDRSFIAPEHKWPIAKSDIDPFHDAAADILDIDPKFWDRPADEFGVSQIEFRFSPPTRFNEKYREQLEKSEHINLVLNASLVAAESSDKAATALKFKSYSGVDLSVRARKYVLATGGIENSRLLLWLCDQGDSALFDDMLPIGKYWMEHPHFTLGMAIVEKEITDQYSFGISPEFQRAARIMNCGLRVEELSKAETDRLVADLKCVAPTYGEKVTEMVDAQMACGARLVAAWEQEPVPGNSIELSGQDKDLFGIPRVVLNWKKGALDRRTIKASAEIFNNWLMQKDLGRIRLDSWVRSNEPYPDDDELAGYHHMGGTRMGLDPRTSVVDANCRVHGTENMYVAGSSVFTTCGHNNPTLPIVQLALRLANHLAL